MPASLSPSWLTTAPAGRPRARPRDRRTDRALIVIAGQPDATGSPTGSPISSGDCLSMPVSEQDLLTRVKAALGPTPTDDESAVPQFLHFEGLVLDTGGRSCVPASGQGVTLTRAEFSLMLTLAKQPGRVLSRDELSYAVAGRAAGPEDRSVDVLISRLRRKIEPDPKSPRIIVTVPSGGYKFSAKPQASPPAAVAVADAQAATAEDKPTTPDQTERGTIQFNPRRPLHRFPGGADRSPHGWWERWSALLASSSSSGIRAWPPEACRDPPTEAAIRCRRDPARQQLGATGIGELCGAA